MVTNAEPRRRDAAASKERLLAAAAELFSDRGFDQTTARDLGELADVDPALIARYFGGKAQLYVAVLEAETDVDSLGSLRDRSRLAALVERTGRQGPGPVLQAAVRPYDDPAAQAAALAELQRRVIKPLRDRFLRDGDENAELRAEVLAAAFVGVILARRAGALEHLAEAGNGELLALLQEMFGAT
jgi:AcrR family transcriptional regulator